jgi:hypothetical protein
MKKFRALLCAVIALLLCAGTIFSTVTPALAQAQTQTYGDEFEDLIGSMEVVNCTSWTSLRKYPKTSSARLARVPVGAIVTNCYYEDDKYTYCEYDGMSGYILNNNLAFIRGPIGYEYADRDYLGNFEIVNCTSYATLRAKPDTRSEAIMRVPLGAIVTNVYYEDDKFSYCMYGDAEGYILTKNLSWLSAGTSNTIPEEDWLGDCVIINCASFASLRELPDTGSERLAKVPLGAKVTDCYFVDDRFACCTYKGVTGYILIKNLGQ